MQKKIENIEQVFDEIGELRQIRKALTTKNPSWTEVFSLLTPVMLFIMAFYLNGLRDDIRLMKTDISNHLQNAEIHIPRSTVVSKDEFVIYQSMRDRQMADIKDSLIRLEEMIQKTHERS